MSGKHTYTAIGMMSGTSMDGLDIACCRFTKNRKWAFEILSATTIRYTAAWRDQLRSAPSLSGEELMALDAAYGEFIGSQCAAFVRKNKLKRVDLVASHGHTIFHQPERGFTFQLGNGNAIHAKVKVPVVFDFRSQDVALGGQGAPLVPVGDRHLFGAYDVCLNLGGIANLSLEHNHQRIAFDICFANMGLNYLAEKASLEFDNEGGLAARGETEGALLDQLKAAYKRIGSKRPSLAREGFESGIRPLLDIDSIPLENRMKTFCESIAYEIARSIPARKKKIKVLATGGGTWNPVLMQFLRQYLDRIAHVEIPSREIIEFKEALVFAFLGVLKVRGEVNVLKSVTRASRNSCSGVHLVPSPSP